MHGDNFNKYQQNLFYLSLYNVSNQKSNRCIYIKVLLITQIIQKLNNSIFTPLAGFIKC